MRTDVLYKSSRNIVYSCKYHVVWHPKYRRKVLVNGVDARLKEILYQTAKELRSEIIELEVMPDHVHLLCEASPRALSRAVDPQFGIPQAGQADERTFFPPAAPGVPVAQEPPAYALD